MKRIFRCGSAAGQDAVVGIALQHPLDVGSADECHAVADA